MNRPAPERITVVLALAAVLLVSSPALSQPGPRSSMLFEQAIEEYLDHPHPDSALIAINQAMELDPSDPLHYRHMAAFCYVCGDIDQTLANLEEAAELAQDDPEVLLDLGFIHVGTRCNEQAVEVLTRALEQDPTLARAYLNRALAHQDQGRTLECMIDLNAAIIMDPGLADAYFYRGTLLGFAFDEWEKAREDFRMCIETTDDPELRWLAVEGLECLPE